MRFGVWGLRFGAWCLVFGVRGQGFGFWVLGFGFWGLGFLVPGFVFHVSSFGLRIWGSVFRVTGVDFGGRALNLSKIFFFFPFITLDTGPIRPLHLTLNDTEVYGPLGRYVRLPGKGNSNSHGARPVHLNITMVKWIRTRRLPIKKFLSTGPPRGPCRARKNSGQKEFDLREFDRHGLTGLL